MLGIDEDEWAEGKRAGFEDGRKKARAKEERSGVGKSPSTRMDASLRMCFSRRPITGFVLFIWSKSAQS